MKRDKTEQEQFDQECLDVREMISNMNTGQPVEIRAPTPKGPKITQEDIDRWNGLVDRTVKIETLTEKIDGQVGILENTQKEMQA